MYFKTLYQLYDWFWELVNLRNGIYSFFLQQYNFYQLITARSETRLQIFIWTWVEVSIFNFHRGKFWCNTTRKWRHDSRGDLWEQTNHSSLSMPLSISPKTSCLPFLFFSTSRSRIWTIRKGSFPLWILLLVISFIKTPTCWKYVNAALHFV
jgi:hypothetical protein